MDPQDRLWRKNRLPNVNGTFGTDVNRNFDALFGGPGTSGNPASSTYHGNQPLNYARGF